MADRNTGWAWLNLTANASVRPSRVVVGVTGAGNALKGIESTSSAVAPFGISKEFTRYQPGSPADDGNIAIANEPLPIYQPGEIGHAIAGAAITDPRLPLVSDAQGRVISLPAATGATPTRFWCIGWPRNTALAAGDKVEVVVTAPFCVVQNA